MKTAFTPPDVSARYGALRKALAAKLAALYPAPVTIVLELGCGHGHFLTAYAEAHPNALCLGVDKITKRIARSERKQHRAKLTNIAFFKADAMDTLVALPPHVWLSGVFMLFPDPWPKQRHHRRRMLQPEMLDALAARAQPGAWLALRSDHAGFFAWAESEIKKHLFWHANADRPWPFEHPTVFQEMQGPHQSLVAVRR